MKKKAGVKSGKGKSGDTIPVNVEKFEKQDHPLPEIIVDFISGIRIDHGIHKGGEEPFDDRDRESLAACHEMRAYALRIGGVIKIILAAIAYKIDTEYLWRGEYENSLECIMKLTGLAESTIYRYIACGRVIAIVVGKHDLPLIPNSLDALTPFDNLENKKDVLKAFRIALSNAKTTKKQVITKAIATKAVEQLPGYPPRRCPNNHVQKSSSPASGENTDAKNNCATAKPAQEIATKLGEQMKELGNRKIGSNKTVVPLLRGMIHVAKAYLKKPHGRQYLENLKELTAKLDSLFEVALAELDSEK